MRTDLVVTAALFVLLGVVIVADKLQQRKARRLRDEIKARLQAEQQPPAPPLRPLEGLWRAMPGQRIELGDTGFWIGFDPTRAVDSQLILFSPEGNGLAYGADYLLPHLKEHAELRAAARMEFNAPPLDDRFCDPWSTK